MKQVASRTFHSLEARVWIGSRDLQDSLLVSIGYLYFASSRFLAWLILYHRNWRRHHPQKSSLTFVGLYGVKFHKLELITTAERAKDSFCLNKLSPGHKDRYEGGGRAPPFLTLAPDGGDWSAASPKSLSVRSRACLDTVEQKKYLVPVWNRTPVL
jgi:hypothetical protein